MPKIGLMPALSLVALRKESVDRNQKPDGKFAYNAVALRKESVDRNLGGAVLGQLAVVALRKESVDRNAVVVQRPAHLGRSLSARRAWIEILVGGPGVD